MSNVHMNIFHHYTQSGSLPIENNISRGWAILLQEYPALLFMFLEKIRKENASNVEMVYKVGVMQLKTKIQNYNNFYRKKYELSVAYGAAFYDSNGDKSIDLVIKEADDNMYNNKAEIKKEKNIL